jgi:hypothetical protein
MVASTRSSAASSPVKLGKQSTSQAVLQDDNSRKIFILPQRATTNARFLSLKHPRDGAKQRFYFCPQLGLFEFTRLSVPSLDLRSILTAPAEVPEISSTAEGTPNAYVWKSVEIFIASPLDVTFILLPILGAANTSKGRTLFQPLDDLIEPHLEKGEHLDYIFRNGRDSLVAAAEMICETVEAGDEKMFKLSEEKMLKVLFGKAQNVVKQGLPQSLEERFVKRALEKPVLSVKRQESSMSVPTQPTDEESTITSSISTSDSQSSTSEAPLSTSLSQASSTTTLGPSSDSDSSIFSELLYLQRLRVAFSFITSSYCPDQLATRLSSQLASPGSPIDFTPLDNYVEHLTSLRAEVLASRSFSNLSTKRSLEADNDAQGRADKKHKLEEEEKRKKANESRGVRDLKKVNVTGMKKMSDFFVKSGTAKAKS